MWLTSNCPKLEVERGMKMPNVKFIVRRESTDEETFALVTAKVLTDELKGEKEFLKALVKGITDWVRTTGNGKQAWEASSHDFNVGDLVDYQSDFCLKQRLQKEGIYEFNVETFSCNQICGFWSYDTVLADEG